MAGTSREIDARPRCDSLPRLGIKGPPIVPLLANPDRPLLWAPRTRSPALTLEMLAPFGAMRIWL